MLVSKNIVNPTPYSPPSISIGDAVRILNIGQMGTVESYRSGKWMVRLTEGSTIECDTRNLEKRSVLTG